MDPTIGEPPSLTDFDHPIRDAERERIGRSLRDRGSYGRPRNRLRAIEGGREDERPPTVGETNRHERDPGPQATERAESVARAALARAEAKLAFDEELARAKHRFEREAQREVTRQRKETIAPFLEVLDDIDRALAASDPTTGGLSQGVEMIRDRFLAKLRDQGVIVMEVDGEPFDPERHEALSVVPVADPALDKAVVGVLRAGYTLHGEVLRPAGVAVGRVG